MWDSFEGAPAQPLSTDISNLRNNLKEEPSNINIGTKFVYNNATSRP